MNSPMAYPSPRVAGTVALSFGAVLALQPLGRSSELAAALCAVFGCGFVLAPSLRARFPPVVLRLVLALFLCYWLPVLFSAPDAVAPAKTWGTVLVDLRFLPLALAAAYVFGRRPDWLDALLRWSGIVLAIWVLDALVQAATGLGLGGEIGADRVSGVFGEDNLKLGPVLAVLSPVLLLAAHARHGNAGLALAWLVTGAAVLMAGARAGWIAYGVVTLLALHRAVPDPRRYALTLACATLAVVLFAVPAYRISPTFAARVDRTLAATDGTEAGVDRALAMRVPIFRTATAMALDHPVNGVGARGFRHAYPDYASEQDPFVDRTRGQGALHPHQLVLELLTETGIPGLLMWLYGVALLATAHRRLSEVARRRAAAPAIALVAMVFPLNTHYAFYSSFWGLLFWWLLAWLLAAIASDETSPS